MRAGVAEEGGLGRGGWIAPLSACRHARRGGGSRRAAPAACSPRPLFLCDGERRKLCDGKRGKEREREIKRKKK